MLYVVDLLAAAEKVSRLRCAAMGAISGGMG
jgi:hypothetical protein